MNLRDVQMTGARQYLHVLFQMKEKNFVVSFVEIGLQKEEVKKEIKIRIMRNNENMYNILMFQCSNI